MTSPFGALKKTCVCNQVTKVTKGLVPAPNSETKKMTLRKEAGSNLTSKQRNFVLYYIQTNGNGPEAAMMAYKCSTRGSARVIAHRNLHNPKIIAYRDSLWSEHNLVERSIRTLAEGMKATQRIITNRKTGESVEFPDHKTRLHAAKMALKLRGVDWI